MRKQPELGERKLIARVLAEAAREAHAMLDQPIKDCLVLLAGSVPGLTAVAVQVRLVTTMEQVKLA